MAEIEQLRIEVEQKIEHHLAGEQNFSGARYTGLDLDPTAFREWAERPSILGGIEPFTPREDIRIILTDHLVQRRIEAYKTIQLHIAPLEETARVKYVYNLRLTVGSPAELVTYVDKPSFPQVGDEPAPTMPFSMTQVDVTSSVLEAFSRFLDQAKPMDTQS